MGLFDSIVGAVSSQVQGSGGLQGLLGALGNQPQLMQAATSLLGNDGEHGGLQGLVDKFQQAGLGDMVNAWISHGPNPPISPEQLTGVLGQDTVANMAGKLGMQPTELAGQLSSVLPSLVDKLTPNGTLPAGGLGQGQDLMGMLSGLFKG